VNSLFKENGAFDQLGRKYFNKYYSAPGSDDYRKVLGVMAEHFDAWVDRATIIKESGLKPSIVDNALRALKGKDAIIPHESRPGHYKLPTRSFAVWIKAKRRLAPAAAENGNNPSLFETEGSKNTEGS
jgi:hypothetical protein